MCQITATELKLNLNKYMVLSQTEDVFVLKNGKLLTVLTNPKMVAFKKLCDIVETLPKCNEDKNWEDIIGEEILLKTK